MADAVHRESMRLEQSIDATDLDPREWLIFGKDRADEIPALRRLFESIDRQYLKIEGDTIVEMKQGEKDDIDATREGADRDAVADELIAPGSILRAFAEVLVDEINDLRVRGLLAPRSLAEFRDKVRAKLNG